MFFGKSFFLYESAEESAKPETLNDLRPVIILPVLSKLLEKIIDKQLRSHLDRVQLLPSF